MSHCKLIILDVDGTLTDGKIYMGSQGEMMKAFNVKDGLALASIAKQDIKTAIITGRTSKIVERRACELSITHIYQGVADKLSCLQSLLIKEGMKAHDVLYIGDDLNDISCMEYVHDQGGLVACPSDAVERVKSIASFCAQSRGGDGAVRDVLEHYFSIEY